MPGLNKQMLIMLLRLSLALVFIWFGALKMAGYNPVYDLVYSVFPYFASGTGNIILGALETAIGVGLFLNIFPKLVHLGLVLHLLATFLTFVWGRHLMFEPYFPILTLAGEFVVKNIVLGLAGLVSFRFGKA